MNKLTFLFVLFDLARRGMPLQPSEHELAGRKPGLRPEQPAKGGIDHVSVDLRE
jgi:hypothetical protein